LIHQGGFPVIDMGDDGDVSDFLLLDIVPFHVLYRLGLSEDSLSFLMIYSALVPKHKPSVCRRSRWAVP